MAKSDYLCCSVCDDKIVYADTMPGTFDTTPITAMCSSCTADVKGIIQDCQAILTRHLPGDGISAKDAISELLGILDGPRTRAVFPNESVSPEARREEDE